MKGMILTDLFSVTSLCLWMVWCWQTCSLSPVCLWMAWCWQTCSLSPVYEWYNIDRPVHNQSVYEWYDTDRPVHNTMKEWFINGMRLAHSFTVTSQSINGMMLTNQFTVTSLSMTPTNLSTVDCHQSVGDVECFSFVFSSWQHSTEVFKDLAVANRVQRVVSALWNQDVMTVREWFPPSGTRKLQQSI